MGWFSSAAEPPAHQSAAPAAPAPSSSWLGRGQSAAPPAASHGTSAQQADGGDADSTLGAVQAAGSAAVQAAGSVLSYTGLDESAAGALSHATARWHSVATWSGGLRERFLSLPDGEQMLAYAIGAAVLYSRLPDPPPGSEPEPEPEPLTPEEEWYRERRGSISAAPFASFAALTTTAAINERWHCAGHVNSFVRQQLPLGEHLARALEKLCTARGATIAAVSLGLCVSAIPVLRSCTCCGGAPPPHLHQHDPQHGQHHDQHHLTPAEPGSPHYMSPTVASQK